MLYGGVAGCSVTCSAMNYIDYATEKAAVLQAHLSRAPELTDKVIESVNQAAEGIGGGNLLKGWLFGGLAGVFAGLALYEAAETSREE